MRDKVKTKAVNEKGSSYHGATLERVPGGAVAKKAQFQVKEMLRAKSRLQAQEARVRSARDRLLEFYAKDAACATKEARVKYLEDRVHDMVLRHTEAFSKDECKASQSESSSSSEEGSSSDEKCASSDGDSHICLEENCDVHAFVARVNDVIDDKCLEVMFAMNNQKQLLRSTVPVDVSGCTFHLMNWVLYSSMSVTSVPNAVSLRAVRTTIFLK